MGPQDSRRKNAVLNVPDDKEELICHVFEQFDFSTKEKYILKICPALCSEGSQEKRSVGGIITDIFPVTEAKEIIA